MYVIRNDRKVPVKISKGTLVEGYSMDWKSPKMWIILGSVLLAIILIILIILHYKNASKHHSW